MRILPAKKGDTFTYEGRRMRVERYRESLNGDAYGIVVCQPLTDDGAPIGVRRTFPYHTVLQIAEDGGITKHEDTCDEDMI